MADTAIKLNEEEKIEIEEEEGERELYSVFPDKDLFTGSLTNCLTFDSFCVLLNAV